MGPMQRAAGECALTHHATLGIPAYVTAARDSERLSSNSSKMLRSVSSTFVVMRCSTPCVSMIGRMNSSRGALPPRCFLPEVTAVSKFRSDQA